MAKFWPKKYVDMYFQSSQEAAGATLLVELFPV